MWVSFVKEDRLLVQWKNKHLLDIIVLMKQANRERLRKLKGRQTNVRCVEGWFADNQEGQ